MSATPASGGAAGDPDSPGAEAWQPGSGAKRWRVRRYWEDIRASPWHHQVFVLLVFLQLVYAIIERIVLFFAAAHTDESLPQDIWFFGMILLTALCVAYYGVHAIVSVNAFELVTFFVTSLMMLLRLVVEYVSKQDECYAAAEQRTCLAFLVIAVTFNGSALLLGGTMYKDLQWKRYRTVGAEVHTRSMYTRFELFTAVKNLDIQFSLVILFTGLVFFSTATSTSATRDATIMNACLFLLELLFERAGNYGVQREHVPSVITFWALSSLMPAFVIYVAFNSATLLPQARSASILGTIAAFAGLAVVNRVATVACSVVLYRNFGERYRGLRRLLERDRLNLMSSFTFNVMPGRGWGRRRGGSKPAARLTPGAVVVANPVRTTSFVSTVPLVQGGLMPGAGRQQEEEPPPRDAQEYLDRVESYLQSHRPPEEAVQGDIEMASMQRGEAHR